MRLIEINLATRPFRNNTLYWAGFGSAALALVAMSALNLWLYFGYSDTMRQHQEDLTAKQGKRDALSRDEQRLSLKLTKLDFKGLAQQSEFANDAIRRRTFSWTRLFNRLEEVVPPSVMMISIRPEIQAEGISIVAEGSAKSQEGLLDFEENLIRNRHFSRIYPGSERREQRGQDLRFSLKFDYLPEGRPDFQGPAPEKDGPPAPAKEPPPAPKSETPTVAAEKRNAPGAAVPVEKKGTPPAGATPSPAAARAASPPPAGAGTAAVPAAPPPAGAAQPSAPASAVRQAAPAPAPAVQPPLAQPPRTGGPRPLLRPGAMGRGGVAGRGGAGPAMGPAARRQAEEEAAARFSSQPLQDVFDYLMKYRSMTFVFAGDFDLRQKVSMDLNNKEEEEILDLLSRTLDCMVTREGMHAYRLSPKSGGEPMEEPPVEEEPAPPEEGGGDSGQEPPP